MGKLLTYITSAINTLLSFFPYSSKQEAHLKISYISAELGNCGIACVAMIVNQPVNDLINQYKYEPFYDDSIGWYHQGLVKILSNFNYSSTLKSGLTIWQLRNILARANPVIVSIKVPHPDDLSIEKIYSSNNPSARNMGHLCILTGYDAQGFYLHDPRNIKGYAENVFVPYRKFAEIFSGNSIIVDKNN